jgi:hypothetical protein
VESVRGAGSLRLGEPAERPGRLYAKF